METAIQLAEWLQLNGYETYQGVGKWINPSDNQNVFTTRQLYENFIKEQIAKDNETSI